MCVCVGESDESLRKKDKAIDDVFSVFFLSPPVGAPWLLPVSVSVPVCVCNFVSLCRVCVSLHNFSTVKTIA